MDFHLGGTANLHPSAIGSPDICFICYNVISADTLKFASSKIIQMKSLCPSAIIFLVGTKNMDYLVMI